MHAAWWSEFGDATLERWVELALQRNHDVLTAMARVDEARANLAARSEGMNTQQLTDYLIRVIQPRFATVNGKSAFRVRIGPYATRAEAESVRLKALDVRSDVPVLFISGTLDGRTPHANAQALLPGFSQGKELLVRSASHDNEMWVGNPAIADNIAGFLAGRGLSAEVLDVPLPVFITDRSAL